MKRNIFLLIILLICFLSSCTTKVNKELKIEKPFDDVDIHSESITLDPNQEQILSFENGLSVEIPKNAFIDKDGNRVTNNVTLSIETYDSPSEIIASGIPMVYFDSDSSKSFESAGMFRIEGKSGNSTIFIDKEKSLIVNYPSNEMGKYDFFKFNQTSNNGSEIYGQWNKLTDNIKQYKESTNANTFKLKFASENYPELEPLSSISWKLSTEYGDPRLAANNWVLKHKWASIEVSEPKYGFANDIISEKVNYDNYLPPGAIFVTKDESKIITSKKPFVKIWTREGKLLKTIDNVRTDFKPFEILNDNLMIVMRNDADYLYDLNGKALGSIPKSHSRILSHSNEVLIYRKVGTSPIIYISNIRGELIKAIELNIEKSKVFGDGIYVNYILTPNDEIVSTSTEGLRIFNLKGEQIKFKKGKYKSVSYIKENTVLIKEQSGNLMVWNYKTDYSIKSKPEYFNLKYKVIDNTSYGNHYYSLKERPFIVINESLSKKTKLWNYENNSIIQFDFYIDYWISRFGETQFVSGYNSDTGELFIYDLENDKNIIQTKNMNYSFSEAGYQYPIISKEMKRIIAFSDSECQLYNFSGELIFNFKKYDSLINFCDFANNEYIVTISENGILRKWDKNCNQLSSDQLDGIEHTYAFQDNDNIATYGRILNDKSIFNKKSELLLKLTNSQASQLLDSTQYLQFDKNKKALLSNLFFLDENTYQVSLRTDNKEFITYVYLNESDINKLDRYYTKRAKRINKEKQRQDIEALAIRRFAINDFGIYNWDKLVLQSDFINFAAKFTFDIPIDFSNITIYLITEVNGPAVIKFYKTTWDNFYINPSLPNKLLAVLPNNKTAIFDDFESIDFNKVLKQGTFTFKMETVDKPITNLIDLENILQ